MFRAATRGFGEQEIDQGGDQSGSHKIDAILEEPVVYLLAISLKDQAGAEWLNEQCDSQGGEQQCANDLLNFFVVGRATRE